MKKARKIVPPAIGGTSLLVIFVVLCLSVFALLSFTTVRAEKTLSDVAAEAVAEYYRADLEAERIFARLRNGEMPPGVLEANDIYVYSCTVSESQTLEVALQKQQESWTVLRWQTVAQPEEITDSITVWNGR